MREYYSPQQMPFTLLLPGYDRPSRSKERIFISIMSRDSCTSRPKTLHPILAAAAAVVVATCGLSWPRRNDGFPAF